MTEREKLDCAELKMQKYEDQSGCCAICGKRLGIDNQPQLAHKIKQSKYNLLKYGKAIIHHPLNLYLVCSHECNSRASLGDHQAEIEEFVKRIQKTIQVTNLYKGVNDETTKSNP